MYNKLKRRLENTCSVPHIHIVPPFLFQFRVRSLTPDLGFKPRQTPRRHLNSLLVHLWITRLNLVPFLSVTYVSLLKHLINSYIKIYVDWATRN